VRIIDGEEVFVLTEQDLQDFLIIAEENDMRKEQLKECEKLVDKIVMDARNLETKQEQLIFDNELKKRQLRFAIITIVVEAALIAGGIFIW
jgi:hypothetical protein